MARNAIITGASSGIGAALARELARRGWSELGGAFDLAIVNAGVSIPGHATKFKLEDADQTIRINFIGMMNLFAAVVRSMVERRTGRFAGVASIAGLRGLPTVGVTIVNPGFIATAMTEKNRFRMPFLMQAEEAAKVIADGLERGKRVVEFPRPMSLMMRRCVTYRTRCTIA